MNALLEQHFREFKSSVSGIVRPWISGEKYSLTGRLSCWSLVPQIIF